MPVNSGASPPPLGGHSTQWLPLWVPEEREEAAVPVVAALEPRPVPPPVPPAPLVEPPDAAPLEVAPAAPPVVVVVVVVVVPAAVVEVPVVEVDEFCTVGSDTVPPPAG